MHARHLPVAVLASVVLAAVAGCSSATDPEASDASAAGAVTIENCGVELTFDEVPSRVVILGGASVAEVSSFVALGIEDSVIANLQQYGVSDDPTLVDPIAALPDGGLTVNESFGPPAEQLLSLQPDLVVSTYAGGYDASLGFASREELASIGANAFITPSNCANGDPDATAEERERFDTAGVDASVELIETLGQIFEVEDRASATVDAMQAQLDAVATAIDGEPTVDGIIVSPGFGSDVPVAWTGAIFDDVLERSGVENVFAGLTAEAGATISAEQLLVAAPEVVVLFGDGSVDFDLLRTNVEEQFPNWPAVQTGTYATVYDGVYLGPTNGFAVETIARVAHPDAF